MSVVYLVFGQRQAGQPIPQPTKILGFTKIPQLTSLSPTCPIQLAEKQNKSHVGNQRFLLAPRNSSNIPTYCSHPMVSPPMPDSSVSRESDRSRNMKAREGGVSHLQEVRGSIASAIRKWSLSCLGKSPPTQTFHTFQRLGAILKYKAGANICLCKCFKYQSPSIGDKKCLMMSLLWVAKALN